MNADLPEENKDEPDRSTKTGQETRDHSASVTPPAHPNSASIQTEIFDPRRILNPQTLSTLNKLCGQVFAQLPNQGQLRVNLVDDQQMSIAHKKFSGVSGTTDVLTFDLSMPAECFDTKLIDADITVCVDEARRQANTHNHPIEHELLLYIVHGLLHCLGYNDHTDAEYQQMHIKEDQLLNHIGIGPVFFSQNQSSSQSITKESES